MPPSTPEEYIVAWPSDGAPITATFDLTNAPADLSTLTDINVRFRIAHLNSCTDGSTTVEVWNGTTNLTPSATTFNKNNWTSVSYTVTGLSLNKTAVDALRIKLVGWGTCAWAGSDDVSAVNLDITYATAGAAPLAPQTLAQYRSDGTTALAAGAWTTDGNTNNVVFKFQVKDPDASQTLTPWVELVPTANAFTGTCGAASAGSVFSGTNVSATTANTWYNATVNVTGLVNGTQYKWRACATDQAGLASAWLVKGGAPDFGVDNAPPGVPATLNDGTGADVDGQTSLTTINANWTAAADVGSGLNRYEYCISSSTNCAGTIIRTWTTNTTSTTLTVSGLTLVSGTTYFVCVRTFDNMPLQSTTNKCSDGVTIDQAAPNVPVLVSPASLASLTSLPTLVATYSDAAPATAGDISFEICAASDCATVAASGWSAAALASGTNGSWSPATLVSGSWWWRARNRDASGNLSAWSTARSFTLTNAPTATPTSPADAAWVAANPPTLAAAWSHLDPGASGYLTFEVCSTNAADPWSANCGASYSSGASAAGLTTGQSGAWQPAAAVTEASYLYWRVRGTDANAVSGAWSAVRSLRVDSQPPAVPTNVVASYGGRGSLSLSWNASADPAPGSGSVTYEVQSWSGTGAAWQPPGLTTECAATTALSCTKTGTGSKTLVLLRVRACDAAGNCSNWASSYTPTAATFYLRSAVNSAYLGSASKRATVANASPNLDSSTVVKYSNAGSGSILFKPVTTMSTAAFDTQPTGSPPAPFVGTGRGWIVDDYAGMSAPAGPVTITTSTTSNSSSGVGSVECRVWKVAIDTATSTITSYNAYYGSASGVDSGGTTVDVLNNATTTQDCVLPAFTSQQSFLSTSSTHEALYIELWLNITSGGTNGRTVALNIERGDSYIEAPEPGTPPPAPTLTAPTSGAIVTATPTLEATYPVHPVNGLVEYRVATDAACTTPLSGVGGTSGIYSSGTATSFTAQALTAGASLYWCARAVATNGLASAWTSPRSISVNAAPNAPTNVSPLTGSSTSTLTPVLSATSFNDVNSAAGDAHAASEWQVRSSAGSYASPAATSGVTTTSLTSWGIPSSLDEGTDYWWRVRYRDLTGAWSAWSAETSFTARSTGGDSVTIDVAGCSGSALSLGTGLPGSGAVTTSDCLVTFGSGDSVAMLLVSQSDGTGAAMVGASASLPDYLSGVNDWSKAGASLFGVCLRSVANGATTTGAAWSADVGDADCLDGDTDPWRGVSASPDTSAVAAMTSVSGTTNAAARLRFGVRWGTQPAGAYVADITLTAVSSP